MTIALHGEISLKERNWEYFKDGRGWWRNTLQRPHFPYSLLPSSFPTQPLKHGREGVYRIWLFRKAFARVNFHWGVSRTSAQYFLMKAPTGITSDKVFLVCSSHMRSKPGGQHWQTFVECFLGGGWDTDERWHTFLPCICPKFLGLLKDETSSQLR